MLNLNLKGTSLRETASYEPSCVKISSVVFPVEDGKKKRKEKGRKGKAQKVAQALYFTYLWGSPRERIFTKFCTSGDMLELIICANFGGEKLSGLGNTRGQIFEFPIEMAGHPYNRAALPRSLWWETLRRATGVTCHMAPRNVACHLTQVMCERAPL